jgi:Arc/MetJ-type ribon-helix-helix transcriptional regulator
MQVLVSKPELQQFITKQVNGGRFGSPTDVVEAALAQLMVDDASNDLDDATRAQLIRANEQIDRGEGYTVAQMREHFRRQASGR